MKKCIFTLKNIEQILNVLYIKYHQHKHTYKTISFLTFLLRDNYNILLTPTSLNTLYIKKCQSSHKALSYFCLN